MLTKALVVETDGANAGQTWRSEEDRRIGLVITAAGLEVLGVAPSPTAEQNGPADGDKPREPCAARAGTKQAQLIALLEREGGGSLDEITAATSWLPHSARAMLTGLRKRGFEITSDKVDGIRRYRIAHREAA